LDYVIRKTFFKYVYGSHNPKVFFQMRDDHYNASLQLLLVISKFYFRLYVSFVAADDSLWLHLSISGWTFVIHVSSLYLHFTIEKMHLRNRIKFSLIASFLSSVIFYGRIKSVNKKIDYIVESYITFHVFHEIRHAKLAR